MHDLLIILFPNSDGLIHCVFLAGIWAERRAAREFVCSLLFCAHSLLNHSWLQRFWTMAYRWTHAGYMLIGFKEMNNVFLLNAYLLHIQVDKTDLSIFS